jgi:hypothetical protein
MFIDLKDTYTNLVNFTVTSIKKFIGIVIFMGKPLFSRIFLISLSFKNSFIFFVNSFALETESITADKL